MTDQLIQSFIMPILMCYQIGFHRELHYSFLNLFKRDYSENVTFFYLKNKLSNAPLQPRRCENITFILSTCIACHNQDSSIKDEHC